MNEVRNDGLPDGWVAVQLDQVAEVRLGRQRSPERATGPYMRPYMRAANVTWNGISLDDVKEMDFTPTEYEIYALRKGDILLGEASGSANEVGKPAVWNEEVPGACFQNTLIRVRAGQDLVPYLYWHFRHDAQSGAFGEASQGINIHHLGREKLAKWMVNLPPLAEQSRIVAKIETFQARSRKTREALEAVPPLLEQFRQSVLAAAFRGDLTAEWRKGHPDVEPASALLDRIFQRRRQREETNPRKKYLEPEPVDESGLPELPEGWCWTRFGDVLSELRNGISEKPEFEPPGHPILRINAVRPGRVSFEDLRYLRGEVDEAYYLREGDLLFTRYNGSLDLLGVCGVVRGLGELKVLYPDKLMRVRFGHDCILPEYVEAYFSAPQIRKRIEEKAKSSAGQQGISGADVKRQVFALPPLDEQHEIVRLLRQMLDRCWPVEQSVSEALTDLAACDQSILAKAFRGELVPQDPADEPASALLERIRAERLSAAGKSKRR